MRFQRFLIAAIVLCFLLGLFLGIAILTKEEDVTKYDFDRKIQNGHDRNINPDSHTYGPVRGDDVVLKAPSAVSPNEGKQNPYKNVPTQLSLQAIKKDDTSFHQLVQHSKLSKETIQTSNVVKDGQPVLNYNVHTFYYLWYGNPEFDNHEYIHWNHPYLPHWNEKENAKWPKGEHIPPDDIGSNFYPELGPYSSQDPKVMEVHMEKISSAGIGVVALSWYPPGSSDDNGKPQEEFIPKFLDVANRYGVKVAFHVEPYKGRNPENFKSKVKYLIDTYGGHPAFHRQERNGKKLPLFYIYDSYLTKPIDWAKIFKPGPSSLRNSSYDGIFIGLLVEQTHKKGIMSSGFDGFYTYFASDGFSFGSKVSNWPLLMKYAKQTNLLFIPSVGPGYIDTQVRPWNDRNTKDRHNGIYYKRMFKAAMAVKPQIISITSFNEWHEGTQIENAVPFMNGKFTYLDYSPHTPDFYLDLTKKYTKDFSK